VRSVSSKTKKRSRKTQAQRSQAMRRRLLDAAVKVLRRRGYAGFRVAEVEAAAGVSRGAQTHHFPTRDELVIQTLGHLFRNTQARALKRAALIGKGDDVVQALLRDSEEFFLGQNFPVAFDLVTLGGKRSRISERVKQIARSTRVPVERAWIEAAIRSGVPPAEAEDLVWMTINVVRGLAVRKLWQNDRRRFARLLEKWHRMARGGAQ
jgi:AcrR family transcriptional regulator